jgi:hypothetical protein
MHAWRVNGFCQVRICGGQDFLVELLPLYCSAHLTRTRGRFSNIPRFRDWLRVLLTFCHRSVGTEPPHFRKSRFTGVAGREPLLPVPVVWTPCPTTSNFTSLSHISPRPFSRAPNEMPVASAGTLSTTSYVVHGRVPRIARCSILSNPTPVSPLSILIHNPAQPATSFDRIHVRNRTRLPAYWVALIDCISVPNPPVSWTVETRYSNLLMRRCRASDSLF